MPKRKNIPMPILKLYRKLRSISTIYLDTCMIGFLTNGAKERECGELIDRYIQKNGITCFISDLVLEELNAAEKVIDSRKMEWMVSRWLQSLNCLFRPKLIKIKEISREEKEFIGFLTCLGISKNDAIHYSIAVFYDKDAFISFNKKIFIRRKDKIKRRLMLLNRKMPEFLDARDLFGKLKTMEKYGFI